MAFLGRFERLDQDFEWMWQHLGIPVLPLPFGQAASTRGDYEDYCAVNASAEAS